MIFFTSDEHYWDPNIIRNARRPFGTVPEMNEELVQRNNSVVKKGDIVYHLGDGFIRCTVEEALKIYRRLNGQHFWIEGNHKDVDKKLASHFGWYKTMYCLNMKDHPRIVLCHYAMRTWSASHKGSWQLYGHSHGKLPEDPRLLSFDVGVDVWNFTPVSLGQVVEKMTKKTALRAQLAKWYCDLHDHHSSEREAFECIEERYERNIPTSCN